MTVKFIPIPTENEPLRTQETQLDGQTYVFTFDWSDREDAWYMKLADATGTVLISGVKLVVGVSLLRTLTSESRPRGILTIISTDDQDPTLTTIHQAKLVYVPVEDQV